jgi:hypothetical protein
MASLPQVNIRCSSGSVLLSVFSSDAVLHYSERAVLNCCRPCWLQGGALSFTGDSGKLLVSNSALNNNEALLTGGAISVQGRKSVYVLNSTFTGNRLLWQGAAGGGFYCRSCSSVNITSCMFSGNQAAFGGGAALMQSIQGSAVYNTSFIGNVASRQAKASSERRHLLASAPVQQSTGDSVSNLGLSIPVADAVGSINVTGDDAYYSGGGGLYVSVSGTTTLQQSVFLSNSATFGGEGCIPAHGTVQRVNNETWRSWPARMSQCWVDVVAMLTCAAWHDSWAG